MKDAELKKIIDVNMRDRSPLCELLLEKKVYKDVKGAKKFATSLRESENPLEELKAKLAEEKVKKEEVKKEEVKEKK
jgi:hypothetical protein